MTTMTRGLIKYQGAPEAGRGEAWQSQVDMAASCLAAAALHGGMPRVAATFGNERQLANFLAERVSDKRRTAALKFMVVTLAEIIGVAAGLYIGAMT
jgi:hypothetical protein